MAKHYIGEINFHWSCSKCFSELRAKHEEGLQLAQNARESTVDKVLGVKIETAGPECPKHGSAMFKIYSPNMQQDDPESFTWNCIECGMDSMKKTKQAEFQQNDLEKQQAKAQQKTAELEKRIGTACIPPRFREFNFDTFPSKALQANEHAIYVGRSYANQWTSMAEQGNSILLLGPTGTGKTGLACSIANHILKHFAETVLFMTAYAAVRHQRDTWGQKNRTEFDALQDLIQPGLLILDEVGTNVGTDSEKVMLFEVLNGRYAARRPTILLANLPLDNFDSNGKREPGLKTFLGDRIIERFYDDGSFVLTMTGDSIRTKVPPRTQRQGQFE